MTKPDGDPLAMAIVGLLIPKTRDDAFSKLYKMGALNEEAEKQLRAALAGPKYAQRGTSRTLIGPKRMLDDYVAQDLFSPISPAKWLKQVRRFDLHGATALGTSPFTALPGKKILDYGSGRINPMGLAIMLFANGADRVISLEPGPVDITLTKLATAELIKEIMLHPARFDLSGCGPEVLKGRVASLRVDHLDQLGDDGVDVVEFSGIQFVRHISCVPDNSVDLVLSCSVFEHVQELAAEILQHRRVMKDGAIGVHTVDFTDHGKTTVPYDPFGFYYSDTSGGLNELRSVDIVKLFEDAGFDVAEVGDVKVSESAIDTERLHERFRGYQISDLVTRQSTFVVKGRPQKGTEETIRPLEQIGIGAVRK